MVKELVLIRHDHGIDRDALFRSWPTAQLPTHQASATAEPDIVRHIINRARPSSDPRAIGTTAEYDLISETWLAETGRNRTHRASTCFETIYPEAMATIDRRQSISFLAEEVVLHPGRNGDVKIISFLRRNSAMSPPEFASYWRGHHSSLVQSVPEFWRHVRGYVQNHPLRETVRTLSGDIAEGFDGVTQLWFDSDQDAVRAFSEPRYLAIIRPDENILRSGDPLRLLAEEIVVLDNA
jgi:EthD domain